MMYILLLFLSIFFCGQYMTGGFWLILGIYFMLEMYLLRRK
jgi:hypothetical protein